MPMHFDSMQQAPPPRRAPKEVLQERKGVLRVGG
jgi:hypothetical protein